MFRGVCIGCEDRLENPGDKERFQNVERRRGKSGIRTVSDPVEQHMRYQRVGQSRPDQRPQGKGGTAEAEGSDDADVTDCEQNERQQKGEAEKAKLVRETRANDAAEISPKRRAGAFRSEERRV